MSLQPPRFTLFPSSTLSRSHRGDRAARSAPAGGDRPHHRAVAGRAGGGAVRRRPGPVAAAPAGLYEVQRARLVGRSEEHTSELQSRQYLVCRLLLEKKISTT